MSAPPLQLVDTFLLGYNAGDALLLVTVLGIFPMLVKRSLKLLSIHFITFGALLVVLPANLLGPETSSVFGSVAMYKAAGLVLIILSPLIFTLSRR